MGASASRIWTDICGLEADDIRAQMIETVLSSPDYVSAARQAGVYATVLTWLSAYRRGSNAQFPYATRQVQHYRDPIQHDTPRWSMYTTPVAPTAHANTELIVSPAAKALDYFQESLALLGIDESEDLTHERLKKAYKRRSIHAHPDKAGGSKEAFDELRRAYQYVEKILNRIKPQMSETEQQRMTAPVTMESAVAARKASALPDAPPVKLSSKKLDMSTFNKLFEENRLPDPARDSGYGDWLSSNSGSDEIAADPRLKGKFNQQTFETVFRERASQQTAGTQIMRRLEPDAIISAGGTELGGETRNFTAAFGSDTQFTDLKDAYTSGATFFQEVADVRVDERKVNSIEEAQRIRAEAMSRVDPDEKSRIAAAAAALEERERQRRLRLAKQDTAAESWHDMMRRRLYVTDG